jgi:hypothetical protein
VCKDFQLNVIRRFAIVIYSLGFQLVFASTPELLLHEVEGKSMVIMILLLTLGILLEIKSALCQLNKMIP